MIDYKIRRAARLLIVAFMSAMVFAFAQDTVRVAFVPQLVGIPYFNAMEEGGNAAAERFGVTFIYTGPTDTNPTDQLRIVNSLIDQGVDAISLAVLDASGIDPLVDRANERGLVLFTSDSDAPDSRRAVFVAQASDEGLGFGLIDELVAQIGGSGKIGIVSGEATATNLNTWISFMQARVEERYPDVELLEPRFAGGTAQRAFQIAADLMTAHPDLKGLIAVASTTCPGVGQAIESAGRIGEVIGTGYCSPNTARSYIKSGAFGFSVLWDPAELGYLTVWAGLQLANGDGFQAVNEVPGIDRPIEFFEGTGVLLLGPAAIFTIDNVDDFDF